MTDQLTPIELRELERRENAYATIADLRKVLPPAKPRVSFIKDSEQSRQKALEITAEYRKKTAQNACSLLAARPCEFCVEVCE